MATNGACPEPTAIGAFPSLGGASLTTPLIISTQSEPAPAFMPPTNQGTEIAKEETGAAEIGRATCPPWLLILAIVVAFLLFSRR